MHKVMAEMPKLNHEVNQKQMEDAHTFGQKHSPSRFSITKDSTEAICLADVINRFGRYPSRNDCMGRESTAEEVEFLKAGPGW